jgi:hypothetical protein
MIPAREFDHNVRDLLKRLKQLVQRDDTALSALLRQLIPLTDASALTSAYSRGHAEMTSVGALADGIVGLAIAEQRVRAYIDATDVFETLALDALQMPEPKRRQLVAAYATWANSRRWLKQALVVARQLLGTSTKPPAAPASSTLRQPNECDTQNAQAFIAYLKQQVKAARDLDRGSADLPNEPVLREYLKALHAAIPTVFGNDQSQRADKIADGSTIADLTDEIFGYLDALVGDRELLDPSVL